MGNSTLTDRVAVDVEHVEGNAVYLRLLGVSDTIVERPAGGSIAVPVTCPKCGADLVAEVFSLDGTRRLRRRARWLLLAPFAGMAGVLLLFGLVAVEQDTAFLAVLLVIVFVSLVLTTIVMAMGCFTLGVDGPRPRHPMAGRRVPDHHRLDVRSW